MLTARVGRMIAGKVGYAAACLLAVIVLVVSGYAYKVVGYASAPANGISTGDTPTTQAMNILVMGLESRTNFYGQALPPALITAMHTGPVGGQDPNTLILIHIFAGGQKAVGFSIPRDDLVDFPHPFTVDGINIPKGKIDNAYDWAYAESLAKTGSSSKNDYLLANQAGQQAEINTVESVTGVHVDHFVETNLAGFYYLAQAFGGVEVCLKPEEKGINAGNYTSSNLYDFNSGFNAVKYDGYNLKKGGAQYLHLSAPQALAFVRERDNLAEGDIDRTRRQQAVIDYVIWQLKHENAFSGAGTIAGLLSVASQTLITDQHLNLLDFSTDMQALSGQHLSFTTLPSVPGASEQLPGYGSSPQSVNIISVPYLKRIVHAAFYPPPPAAKAKKTPAKKAATIPPAASGSPSASSAPTAPTGSVSGGGTIIVGANAKYGIPCVH